ncbi:hypothetical protein K439DRAFT_1637554 [Ramaria rubella]|nr:hypothetical protein K439DRAFT_1637554 [Ramaria rubella]
MREDDLLHSSKDEDATENFGGLSTAVGDIGGYLTIAAGNGPMSFILRSHTDDRRQTEPWHIS